MALEFLVPFGHFNLSSLFEKKRNSIKIKVES